MGQLEAWGGYTSRVQTSENSKVRGPQAGWFSRQSRRMQAMLLALLFLAVSAGLFLLSMHEMHTGEPLTNMAGKSDWADGFFLSAGALVLSALLFAAALGWKPKESDTPPQK